MLLSILEIKFIIMAIKMEEKNFPSILLHSQSTTPSIQQSVYNRECSRNSIILTLMQWGCLLSINPMLLVHLQTAMPIISICIQSHQPHPTKHIL